MTTSEYLTIERETIWLSYLPFLKINLCSIRSWSKFSHTEVQKQLSKYWFWHMASRHTRQSKQFMRCVWAELPFVQFDSLFTFFYTVVQLHNSDWYLSLDQTAVIIPRVYFPQLLSRPFTVRSLYTEDLELSGSVTAGRYWTQQENAGDYWYC